VFWGPGFAWEVYKLLQENAPGTQTSWVANLYNFICHCAFIYWALPARVLIKSIIKLIFIRVGIIALSSIIIAFNRTDDEYIFVGAIWIAVG
jgi:hypothetical protein